MRRKVMVLAVVVATALAGMFSFASPAQAVNPIDCLWDMIFILVPRAQASCWDDIGDITPDVGIPGCSEYVGCGIKLPQPGTDCNKIVDLNCWTS